MVYLGYQNSVKAYVINTQGTVYGKPLTFEMPDLVVNGIFPTQASVGSTVTILEQILGLIN